MLAYKCWCDVCFLLRNSALDIENCINRSAYGENTPQLEDTTRHCDRFCEE